MKLFASILILIAFLTGMHARSFGQVYFPEDLIKITGQVVDSTSKENLASVQVLNFRVHGGTLTDSNGKFSIQADPSDTLAFKLLGYKERKIPVSQLVSEKEYEKKITLTVNRIQIPGVEVKGNVLHLNLGLGGKQNPIPSDLRSEDFSAKPKLLSAVFNPLAFAHYKLSKSEREKRAVLAAMQSDRDWQILSLVYNKGVVQKITSLTGDDLDDFMVYCNAYSGFKVNATPYEVQKTVKDLFIQYKKTHHLKN